MLRISAEFDEIMKDETFDKKEFGFSKNMLRLKKKYPLPSNSNERKPAEELNRIKEHTEMINQAFNINLASGATNFLQKQRDAQKELEKQQLAQNIYQSTVILQGKQQETCENPAKNLKNAKNARFLRKSRGILRKELTNKPEKIESFTKFEEFANPGLTQENRRKAQEKTQKLAFLALVDAYERDIEEIDRELATKSAKFEEARKTAENVKVFQGKGAAKLAKNYAELANSTNFLSFKAQAAKQKNLAGDAASSKEKNELLRENHKKNKEKSPLNRAKSRFQVSFDYVKVVESTLL